MTLDQQLDLLVSNIPSVSENKHYWLIRTQGGAFYEDFLANNYVAIEPANIGLTVFKDIEKRAAGNPGQLSKILKSTIKSSYHAVHKTELSNRSVGLDAGQIIRFAHEVRKGDIIIIPSYNSDYISIGEITESYLAEFDNLELEKIRCPYELRRRVKWLKSISRTKLDINLYMVFTTHQMINQIDKYANVIERTINSFYVLYQNAHLIFNVEATGKISARDLFGFGNLLLETLDEYAKFAEIDISSEHFDLEVNINSPGKLDLKSKIKKTTYVLGFLTVLCGGGYENKEGTKIKSDGVQTIIQSIAKFLNQRQDRELKDRAFNRYIDSLKIKSPEEFNKLMKQFSENKDLPKK